MATLNSKTAPAVIRAIILGVWLTTGFAAAADGTTNTFAARAGVEFHRTQFQFESDTNNFAAAWQFARACFDFADFATNDTRHAAIARLGITASRQAIALQPDSAAGHYYLGLNLGQLARVETLGALRLVRQMEREFKTAASLDRSLDDGGPERTLGLLYRDAPGWPVSIGSRRKALDWLNQAEKVAPACPENHLNLLESYLQWHNRPAAEQELRELDAIWPAARTNLAGPQWDRDWADWSTRRDDARKRLGETSEPGKSQHDGH